MINFDIAVVVFLIMNICLNIKYDVKTILLSFIAWDSIGNSNWFVFAILLMYVITYICSKITRDNISYKTAILITIGSLISILALYFLKESFWYNTLLCYSLGIWYGIYKEDIDKLLRKYYYYILGIIFISFTVLYLLSSNFVIYELLSCIFCLLCTVVTYKIKLENKILLFIGKHAFEIYILQKIAFTIYENLLSNNICIYFIISLITTILISITFKFLTSKVDKLITIKNVKKWRKKT